MAVVKKRIWTQIRSGEFVPAPRPTRNPWHNPPVQSPWHTPSNQPSGHTPPDQPSQHTPPMQQSGHTPPTQTQLNTENHHHQPSQPHTRRQPWPQIAMENQEPHSNQTHISKTQQDPTNTQNFVTQEQLSEKLNTIIRRIDSLAAPPVQNYVTQEQLDSKFQQLDNKFNDLLVRLDTLLSTAYPGPTNTPNPTAPPAPQPAPQVTFTAIGGPPSPPTTSYVIDTEGHIPTYGPTIFQPNHQIQVRTGYPTHQHPPTQLHLPHPHP